MARNFARACNWITEESHPADWENDGRGAGFIRNQRMVDLGADVCLAFVEGASRGTRDCMKRAGQAGIPLVVHYADVDNETGEA